MLEQSTVLNGAGLSEVFVLLVPSVVMGFSAVFLRCTLFGSRYVGSDISFGIAIGFFLIALKESFCRAIINPIIDVPNGELSQLIILSFGIVSIITGVVMLFCEGRLEDWQLHISPPTRPLDRRGALFFFSLCWVIQSLFIGTTGTFILIGLLA